MLGKFCFQFWWRVREMFETGCEYDVLCFDDLTSNRSSDKVIVRPRALELLYVNRKWLNVFLFLKPIDVRKIKLEREGLDILRCFTLRLQVRFDRMHVERIEMPIASRTQKHTFRHVPSPKLHWLAGD